MKLETTIRYAYTIENSSTQVMQIISKKKIQKLISKKFEELTKLEK